MVRQGREMEGGGVRVLLPPHHSPPGTFPGDISKGHFLLGGGVSSVLGHPGVVCAHDLAFRRSHSGHHAGAL